jgi:hypothetical protein
MPKGVSIIIRANKKAATFSFDNNAFMPVCAVVRNRTGFSKLKHFIARSAPADAPTPTRPVAKERASRTIMAISSRLRPGHD